MRKIESGKCYLDIGGLRVGKLMPCIGKDGNFTHRQDLVKASPYEWRRLLDRLNKRPTSPEPPQELAQNE